VVGSGFGIRLNAPGLIPANRLEAVAGAAGFAASSAVDFASGFAGAAPSENPLKSSVGVGTAEGFWLSATPFAASSSGGVIGLATADEAGGALVSSTLAEGGGVDLASVAGDGEGDALEEPASHCPNGAFGDADRGLSDEGFSPLTSSSSPPDTGVFARGELRSGRVLGRPRLMLELGDGVSEGDGSVGVGCFKGVCNDNPPFDGDPGGVVLFARVVDDSWSSGLVRCVDCTLIKGHSAFGVLEGDRDFGKGITVGSVSEGWDTWFSPSSSSCACTSSSSSSSSSSSLSSLSLSPPPESSSSSSSSSSSVSRSSSTSERNSSICCSLSRPRKATPSTSSSRETSTNDDADEDKLLNELAAETTFCSPSCSCSPSASSSESRVAGTVAGRGVGDLSNCVFCVAGVDPGSDSGVLGRSFNLELSGDDPAFRNISPKDAPGPALFPNTLEAPLNALKALLDSICELLGVVLPPMVGVDGDPNAGCPNADTGFDAAPIELVWPKTEPGVAGTGIFGTGGCAPPNALTA
jgi:hypothetical protein